MNQLDDNSVHMILADLPYGTTRCRWDEPLDLKAMWKQFNRICCGPVLLFAQTPFDKVLGASNLRMLRYEWIWEKARATGHLNANRAPMKAHENILVFYRKQPAYHPIKTCGHARKTVPNNGGNSVLYGEQIQGGSSYDSTERYPRSVIRFRSEKQTSKLHPTQKPVDLCRYLIRTYSRPGDTVLDNVMGSGTTGVAALLERRNFVGIEKDRRFFEVAATRLNDPVGQCAEVAS